MQRRTIFIIVIAIVVATAAIYLIFLRPSAGPTANPGGQTGTLPGISGSAGVPGAFPAGQAIGGGAVSVSLVSNGPVAAYFADASGTVTVVRPDGTVALVAGGQESSMSSSTIANFGGAVFSRDGKKIAVSSGNPQSAQTSIFDTLTHSWTQLSTGTLSPAWSPADMRLAYLRDNANGTESIITLDFSKQRPAPVVLGDFYLQEMALRWISAGTIMVSSHPSGYAQSAILSFDVFRNTMTPVMLSRAGAYAAWSGFIPTIGLAFSTNAAQRGGNLQLIDQAGDILQNFSFLTLPSKCAFGQSRPSSTTALATSSTSGTPSSSLRSQATSTSASAAQFTNVIYAYCGVPRDQQTLAFYPLPDAYAEHSIFTSDDLYRIDIANGHVDTVVSGATQNFDISEPGIFGNRFYFINRYDQKLYSVVLP